MNDFSRLEQKLAKLRQRNRAPGEARVLRGSGERLVAAILTEIDETILPRRVSFAADGGKTLHLAVGNRRLQALVAPAPVVDQSDAVTNVALKSVEDDAVMVLRDVVAGFVDGAEALTVTTARFVDLSPPSDVGVPVDQLAKAWGLDAMTGRPADPVAGLTALVEGLGTRADGWLRIQGEEVVAQDGSDDVITGLTENAGVFLDAYFGKKADFESGGAVGFVFSAPDGASVVFLDVGEAMAFIRADAAAAYGIARDWQQASAL